MREEEENLYRRTHEKGRDAEERRLESAFKPEDFHFLKVLGKGSFGKASVILLLTMLWLEVMKFQLNFLNYRLGGLTLSVPVV